MPPDTAPNGGQDRVTDSAALPPFCEVHGCRGRWDADQPHTLCGKATTTSAGPAADHHPTIEGACCNGLCRRKQPPMVMRSALTGTWYVVTRYKHLGDGRFEAIEKHLLARESADQLEALTNG